MIQLRNILIPLFVLPVIVGCTSPGPAAASPPPVAAPGSTGSEASGELQAQAAPAAPAPAVEPPVPAEPEGSGTENAPEAAAEPALPPTAAAPSAAPGAFDPVAVRAQIQPDPEPPEIIRNSHYWVSNESSHFLFRDTVQGVGGAYMGVGTDQNYLIAGWARSELVFMLDFDQQIANTHDLYGIAFANSTTPDEFLSIWRDEGPVRFEDIVPAAVDAERASQLLRSFSWGGTTVFARLRRIVRQYGELGIPTFMTSQDDFDYWKQMWADGRVIAIRGDLTADQAIQDVAHVLHQLNIPMRVVYTSNAEQYFEFVPSFRRNMLVLPFDETSWLLRTRPMASLGLAPDDEYHYSVQPGLNLQMWMAGSSVANAQRLMRQRSSTGVTGLSIIQAPLPSDATPPPVAEARWPEDMATPDITPPPAE